MKQIKDSYSFISTILGQFGLFGPLRSFIVFYWLSRSIYIIVLIFLQTKRIEM